MSKEDYNNRKKKVLTTFLDGVKMFTGWRWRGCVRQTRRDPERNVPPGIPEFSPVRFFSGPPPLPGSWLVQPDSPPLSPYSVLAELVSCRAYCFRVRGGDCFRVRGETVQSESGSITNTDIY